MRRRWVTWLVPLAFALLVPAATSAADSATSSNRPEPARGWLVPLGVVLRDTAKVHAYTPQEIRAYYGMGELASRGLTGKGETIGIVDVYGSPTIRRDLAAFDAEYGLPPPPSFSIVRPAGPVPPFDRSSGAMLGWAGETTLDVEWAHAMAPGASIVLAETGVDEVEGTSGFAQIMRAERYLIYHEKVAVISQSFAATEETFPSRASLLSLRGAFFDARSHHVTVLGATGDAGATSLKEEATSYYLRPVTSWPATDPLVTAVGGVRLTLGRDGASLAPPRAWNDGKLEPEAGSGGISAVFSRPSWQKSVASVVGSHRGVPDISMDAACSRPALIYASYDSGDPHRAACGTSLAAPLFASVVAVADQLAGRHLGFINPTLYKLGAEHAPGLVGVTLGDNTVHVTEDGVTHTVRGYAARKGYNLAVGWGTVDAAALVPELAGTRLPG